MMTGKEALIALANGEEVEFQRESSGKWQNAMTLNLFSFSSSLFEFRLKPRTITINGIEAPAPFEPKEGEQCCYISDDSIDGYHTVSYNRERYSGCFFGLYRPSEIKQVVAALRSIFK